MGEPKISVIAVARGSRERFAESVENALERAGSDVEMVLAGEDDCGALADELARRDGRVIVARPAAHGFYAARNAALLRARGEWICFLEEGDRLAPDFSARLMRHAEGDEQLICFRAARRALSRKASVSGVCDISVLRRACVSPLPDDPIPAFGARCAWTKAFRARTLRSVGALFPEQLSFGGDVMFLLRALSCLEKVRVTNEALYLRAPRACAFTALEDERALIDACGAEIARFCPGDAELANRLDYAALDAICRARVGDEAMRAALRRCDRARMAALARMRAQCAESGATRMLSALSRLDGSVWCI